MFRKIGILFVVLASALAQADCQKIYESELITRPSSDSETKTAAGIWAVGMGPTSVVVGMSALTSGSIVVGSVFVGGGVFSTVNATGVTSYLSYQMADLRKGYDVVSQLQQGDGLALRALHSELTTETAISFEDMMNKLMALNQTNALCTPRPFSFSQIKELLALASK